MALKIITCMAFSVETFLHYLKPHTLVCFSYVPPPKFTRSPEKWIRLAWLEPIEHKFMVLLSLISLQVFACLRKNTFVLFTSKAKGFRFLVVLCFSSL